MALYDALELTVIGQEQREYVRVPKGKTAQWMLNAFINKTYKFAGIWVDVQHGRYIRYDRVASVSIVTGLEDERPPRDVISPVIGPR
jgi:hypothetical protein